jgi:hypothetical protein
MLIRYGRQQDTKARFSIHFNLNDHTASYCGDADYRRRGPDIFGTAAVASELSKWNGAGPVLELLSLAGVAIALTSCCNYLFIITQRALRCLYLSSL